jgi:hypothetical protein
MPKTSQNDVDHDIGGELTFVDGPKSLKRFLKLHPQLKEQYAESIHDCFTRPIYDNNPHGQMTLHEFKKQMWDDVMSMPPKPRYYSPKQPMPMQTKVFLTNKEFTNLIFSCDLQSSLSAPSLKKNGSPLEAEVEVDIEFHSVCVPKNMRGKSVCKKTIPKVIQAIQYKCIHEWSKSISIVHVKILCESKNNVACKCYRRNFGDPVHVSFDSGQQHFTKTLYFSTPRRIKHGVRSSGDFLEK